MFDLGNVIESYLLILITIFFSLLIVIFIFISIILTRRPKTTYSSTPLRKFFRGEKIDHEKWVIVCGPVGSGKSNLLLISFIIFIIASIFVFFYLIIKVVYEDYKTKANYSK